MNKKNCPNCGAPYDSSLNKCPYCNTSYFDMSAIDIYENKPFYLKLKAGNMIFTSMVRVKPDVVVSLSSDSVDIISNKRNVLNKIITNRTVNIDIGFESVVNDGRLYTLEIETEGD